MKKFINVLLLVLGLLSLNSCDCYAQGYYMINNGVVYEYSYESYPVRYFGGIPYYYCLSNGIWRWIVLPRTYYPHIVHHYPRRYVHPNNGYRRPDVRFSQPHRPNYNGRNYNHGNNCYNNGGYRNHNINRGGGFNHSSSRGRR